MNVKIDINLAKLGKIIRSSRDGHMYLDIEELVNRYGYVADNSGEPHLTMSALERKEPSQYGETHSVTLYDNQTKSKSYMNGIRIKELIFGDKQQEAPKKNSNVSIEDIF